MARRKQVLYWCVLALLLAGWLYIAWNVPYTHDDWDWGLPEGLERWLSGTLNNRYAGTFFVLAMTRSQSYALRKYAENFGIELEPIDEK